MRREVLVAIILGIGLGALVAFGLWRANLSFAPSKSQPAPITENSSGQTPEIETGNLIVTQPEDNLVISQERINVQGSTTPKSTVVILTPADEVIIESQQDGSFEAEVLLEGGPNELVVKSYDEQGNESQQKLNVVYSTELTTAE